uniref:Phospholipase D beta 2-like isoform X2 n=1 Tax=Rhizophora mucronata TaxID=61149 RepID=A0A2P2K5I2_RHIMU
MVQSSFTLEELTLCLTQLCFFPAIRGQSSTCTDECLKKWSVSSSWVPMIPSCNIPMLKHLT